MNKLALLLLLPALAFGQATINGVPNQASSGIQYPTTTRHVILGDSLWVVGTHDSSQDAAVNAFSCNGTTCTGTFTSTAPSWNVNGNRVQFTGNITGYALWNPSCVNFSEAVIVSHTSSTFTINEADTIVPGRAGCTGTVSGTGGVVYNAENLAPSQAMRLDYFTNGNSVVPQLYNRAWPGENLATIASNIAAKIGDLNPDSTGIPAELWMMSDDACGSNTLAAWQSQIGTILTYAHAHGWYVDMMAIPNGPISCGLGPPPAPFFTVNSWLGSLQCSQTGTANPSPCADRVVDTWGEGLNDWADVYIVQTGTFSGHLTTEGAGELAAIMNKSRVHKDRARGQTVAGLGPNQFEGLQVFAGAAQGSNLFYDFQQQAGNLWITVNGQDAISNLGIYRSPYNYWQYLQRASECWSENDSNTIADYGSAPGGGCISEAFQGSANAIYAHKIAFGSGVFPSITTPPTPGAADGGIVTATWIIHGQTSDINCAGLLTTDGALFYNSTSKLVKGCDNGGVFTLPSAGFANPMTTLGDVLYGGASGVATRLAGPTTSGHQFVLGAAPSGSAVAPAWLDLATYLASPAAIGGTAPAAGTFTQVTVAGSGASGVDIGVNVFSALTACSGTNEGTVSPVTDSTTNTWGATVTGGGSNHILAYCDGTNWTVAAK